jgi:uncharacterized protein (DUF433 family)
MGYVGTKLMPLDFASETVPLAVGADGVVRITGSRVTLDTVVAAFLDGALAEEIVQRFPTLALADVYSVIGYYLRRKVEVDTYLAERAKRRVVSRTELEERFAPEGIRERLLKRSSPVPDAG